MGYCGFSISYFGVYFYQNDVLAKFFYIPKRDGQHLIAVQQSEQPGRARHKDRQDQSRTNIELEITDMAEPCAVANIDDLLAPQLAEGRFVQQPLHPLIDKICNGRRKKNQMTQRACAR